LSKKDSSIRILPTSSLTGWTFDKMPRSLYEYRPHLGPYCILVYGALLYSARGNTRAVVGHARLSILTGISVSSVQRALKRLRESRLIRPIHRYEDGEQTVNEYELLAR
jgi:DNA-binding transcriptional ArsR family regulator